jgi:hypothetical protein
MAVMDSKYGLNIFKLKNQQFTFLIQYKISYLYLDRVAFGIVKHKFHIKNT